MENTAKMQTNLSRKRNLDSIIYEISSNDERRINMRKTVAIVGDSGIRQLEI